MNNFQHLIKTCALGACLFLVFSSITSCSNQLEETPLEKLQFNYKTNLLNCSLELDSLNNTNNLENKKLHFLKARMYFKKCEPILSYFEKENYKSLNSPNLLRIEEEDLTDIKIRNPFGFQVIEESLFSEQVDTARVNRISLKTKDRILFIHNNTRLKLKNHHIIWIIKDAIVRISTMGITNFDSPVLGQSLKETQIVYNSILELLTTYKPSFTNKTLYNAWVTEIENSINDLNSEFDSFDRYSFIQKHTNKQLQLINKTTIDWNVTFPFELALSNRFNSLFDKEMFNFSDFTNYKSDTVNLKEKVVLGKKLFHDKSLSNNNQMSCATCHVKSLGFTDGRKTFDKNQTRNTPTLSYSGLQRSFFHDARASSLEGQIIGVVNNHNEFSSSLNELATIINSNEDYKKSFDSLYIRKGNNENIRHAIASYVRTLSPFDSKFDNNINTKETTLTISEKEGFNLFMSKAACATCHFPPLFNGTVPPNFTESELELIGTPKTNDFLNAYIDTDLGRYTIYKTDQKKFFFKTPTLRNIALTAPYMHNGVYNTLEEVLDFYDAGGGIGLGMELEHQTLPSDSLRLTTKEKENIIAFLKTLTDESLLQ